MKFILINFIALFISLFPVNMAFCFDSEGLEHAISSGDTATVKSFLLRGGNPNQRIDDIWEWHPTLLHVAVKVDNPTIVKLLLEHKANPKVKDKYGVTPLMLSYNLEISKMLLKSGADVNAQDRYGRTVLFSGYILEKLAKLYIDYGADVNIKDKNLQTPLYSCDSSQLVKMFMDAGADVNVEDKNGTTPLHSCCDPKAIQMFIDAGLDVNKKDHFGNTPLHMVCSASANLVETIPVLVKNGADINAKNNDGDTPLHLAVPQNWITHVSSTGRIREYPFHENVEIVKQLLELGADKDVNIRNNAGMTPIMRLVMYNFDMPEYDVEDTLKVVRLLCKYGATISEEDEKKLLAKHNNLKNDETYQQIKRYVLANLYGVEIRKREESSQKLPIKTF